MHGLMILIGLNLLTWFSIPFFREKYYKVFLITHITGFVLVPVGLVQHAPRAIPYVCTGCGIYIADHVIRILKTKIRTASLLSMSELELTRIEIPHLSAGWRPGQHVRIRVLSGGMGFVGWCEAHPFTIAGINGDRMVLMCKNAGDWTNKLYKLAQSAKSPEDGTGERSVTVIVEGPYGGIGHTLMDRFSGALFFAGGSGITFCLAAIQDLVMKDVNGQSHVKFIELIWSIKDAGTFCQSRTFCISTFLTRG
jgi:ferric-chelate reductase